MTQTNVRARTRNLGIVAHVDAGKTTLTERVLFHAGRIHRIGNVDAGTTTTDTRPEEVAKGITITAAAVTCAWRDHQLTLIDTPGHADFTIEVERSLRVLDGAVLLLDAVAGVEAQTEKVWNQAERWGVPRIAFVNKLDRAGADLERTLASIRERLGATPALMTLPIGTERDHEGHVDLVRLRAVRFDEDGRPVLGDIPLELLDAAREARASLVTRCAEVDDTLLEKWVEGDDVTGEELIAALRRGTLEGRLLPVLAGSALANRGVPPLLDAVVDLLPAPEEGPPLRGLSSETTRPRSVDAPLAALCFKVVHDDHGTLAMVRVYSGVLRRGDSVGVGGGRDKLRVGRLVRLFADRREAVEEVPAGGIAGVIGARLSTGDTLSALDDRMLLEPIRSPRTVMRVAMQPRGPEDRDRLPEALRRILSEDPSLRVSTDPETGQTTLAGMGQLHLEIWVSRLASEHRVEVEVGEPKVAYRETIMRAAEVVHTHSKQTGGPGQWARVALRLEPTEPGEGLVFEDRIKGGAIPREYVPAVFAGCRDAATSGPLGGHPVVDTRIILLDGETHPNDSSEQAFAHAGHSAFELACREAGVVQLEPLMRIELRVPEVHVGDVVGDLCSRRGRVLSMEPETVRTHRVVGEVPLAELFGYASDLGSLTRGRGTHHLELARYARVPS